MAMLPVLLRALLCIALSVAAGSHLWVHRHRPPGWGRLALCLPVLLALQLPPLLFDPQTETWEVIFSINFPWLTASTVVGWAVGRGSQAQPFPHLLAFLAFLFCPALPASSAQAAG
jgi:hypothetical protein